MGYPGTTIFPYTDQEFFSRKDNPQCFEGLPVHNILLDVDSGPDDRPRRLPAIDWPEAQEYLKQMETWGTRASWGGAAELRVLAGMSRRRIFLAERHNDNTWQLFDRPLGSAAGKPDICVVWNGGHYDAVYMPPEDFNLLFPPTDT